MLSIWEKEALLEYDFIIIGAGITGLSAALSLREKKPHASILILERGLLPTGASTKNAGFACIGTIGENLNDIALLGEDRVIQLMIKRWEGLQLTRKRTGDSSIDFEQNGGYELLIENKNETLDKINYLNTLLKPHFKKPIYSDATPLIPTFGFNKKMVKGMVFNHIDGQLHSGKMIHKLWQLCGEQRIKIITGAEVISVPESSQKLQVVTQLLNTPESVISFGTSQLLICTNAFIKKLLPDVKVCPARGQVLTTSPIPNLPFKGTFNFDEGYYYFRNLNNRILFGGGRNLNFEAENTIELKITQTVQHKLEWYLREMIVPDKPFSITERWAGIMGFGIDKTPEVRRYSERICIGVKLNGMGVALGSKIGEELALLSIT
jgi:glycine/D-amino acid oxidase-like deaminating enzyme